MNIMFIEIHKNAYSYNLNYFTEEKNANEKNWHYILATIRFIPRHISEIAIKKQVLDCKLNIHSRAHLKSS